MENTKTHFQYTNMSLRLKLRDIAIYNKKPN